MKKVSILSGGLDSSILTYKMVNDFGADNVIALTYNYGQRHNIEIEMAKKTCAHLGIPHHIVDISFLGDIIKNVSALSNQKIVDVPTIREVIGDPQPPSYVPYRNLILLSLGLSFAESNGADAVYSGLQAVDEYGYWDTSTPFVNNLNAVSSLNRKNQILIEAPFINLKKCDEIEIGKSLNVRFEDTWSCYKGEYEKGACGICPTCAERIKNFAVAGITDPIPYQVQIPWGRLIEENRK